MSLLQNKELFKNISFSRLPLPTYLRSSKMQRDLRTLPTKYAPKHKMKIAWTWTICGQINMTTPRGRNSQINTASMMPSFSLRFPQYVIIIRNFSSINCSTMELLYYSFIFPLFPGTTRQLNQLHTLENTKPKHYVA